MEVLETQIRTLPPSAKEPLFRRLMVDESLAYLREKNHIIGFELDLEVDQELFGFTLIAIQKHTIYAYCSDLHEKPKLILFPPLEKLFDPEFGLLDLAVVKRRFGNSKFTGPKLGSGPLRTLVKDLTPPEKEVDIPPSVAEQMAGHVENMKDGKTCVSVPEQREEIPVQVTKEEPVVEEPMSFTEEPPFEDDLNSGFVEEDAYAGFDESGYNDYDAYDSYGDSFPDSPEPEFEEEFDEPEPVEDLRSTKLKAQQFSSLSEVSDFCSMQLGVQRPLAVNLVNKALQSNVSPEYRIALAVKLFCKLFDEKKI